MKWLKPFDLDGKKCDTCIYISGADAGGVLAIVHKESRFLLNFFIDQLANSLFLLIGMALITPKMCLLRERRIMLFGLMVLQ